LSFSTDSFVGNSSPFIGVRREVNENQSRLLLLCQTERGERSMCSYFGLFAGHIDDEAAGSGALERGRPSCPASISHVLYVT